MNQSNQTEAIRILHVEDNKHDQVAFKRAFKDCGCDCTITCLRQGETALELFDRREDQSFDILVADHGLPGITGLELCKELLEHEISVPVVLLTGIGTEKIAVEALQAGIDDYIIKDPSNRYFEFLPYTIKEIVQKHKERNKRIKTEEALLKSEQQYKALIETIPQGIQEIDKKGNILFGSPAYHQMLGYNNQELIGVNLRDILPKKVLDRTMAYIDYLVSDQPEPTLYIDKLKKKDGTIIDIEIAWNYKRNKKGAVIGFISVISDITLLKRAREKIRTLSQVIEQSPVAVVITTTDAKIEYVNAAFEEITGYCAAEVLGQNPRFLKSGLTPENRYKELWQTIAGGKPWQGEFQNRKKNGELFWEHAHIAPVVDESGRVSHYLAVMEDITLRKKQEAQLLRQAHCDTLTGLPNRFLALDRLSQLLREAGRDKTLVAVLFLDLDNFKKVNDTLGHEVGDKLLIEMAERLCSISRNGDTVGRLGGDEFIVLLNGLSNVVDTRPVVLNIIEQFKAPFKIEGHELIMSASLGISIYPEDGDTISELLRKADSAMYHAKAQGRNTYSYHTEAMNREVSRRLELEEQMHGALERGEFFIYYQPILKVGSGRIIGAEALLRWHSPVLGNVPPMDFISIAEQCGLIEAIGQFVLNAALDMCARWHQKQDYGFRIAVNLSPRQFHDPNMVRFIEETLAKFGLSAECLELEITEGVLMSGHRHVHEALAALSHLGVSISMDDFGTGYSSLSNLRIYPFDILKIDRSFVQDITTDLADRTLINATIAMAHGLKLKVVAEGVETKEQLAYLKKQGCDYAQGCLFSEPMTSNELYSWASKWDGEGF